ncbi:MAG: helix-turn-helix transcriptional regulator, partial [Eubacteriaceae bacterium]|nr:helix-turn-helix transcriptional regulator [Eubacteriaceae bacterium]
VLDGVDFYNWILRQNHTEVLTEWFMDLCVKLMEKMRVSQKAEENEIISQACEYIAENISDPDLGLQSVSDNAGLSVAYFSQLFKTEKGIGLNSYITENRVTNAMRLLETTELKAEEIAERCGFSTASYFGRVFKKQTGMTPGEYRSRSRGAQDSRVY